MTTASERIEVYEMRERRIKLAISYLRSSGDLLHAVGSDRVPLNLPMSSSYWDLLDRALIAALDIVEALPDDFFEWRSVDDYFGLASSLGVSGKANMSDGPLEAAEKLVAAIKGRREQGEVLRRVESLENVDGRTPEEAAAFRRKASELRERHGLAKEAGNGNG